MPMDRIRYMSIRIAATLLALAVAGCSGQSPSTPPANVTVYAASSLTAAFKDLAAAYQAAYPGTAITLSFDASSALRAQIEQGAPADVFAAADTATPQKLIDEGLTSGGLIPFARNSLTLIVPAGSSTVATPLDLAKPGVRVIAAGDTVPISVYTRQVLANLAGQAGYPADFAARVTANIASREDNVKAVVSKIELGEGDAAIVYVTDAKASSKVRAIEIPSAANVPAIYAVVALKAARSVTAQAFVAWIASSAGQAILAKYGFLPPG